MGHGKTMQHGFCNLVGSEYFLMLEAYNRKHWNQDTGLFDQFPTPTGYQVVKRGCGNIDLAFFSTSNFRRIIIHRHWVPKVRSIMNTVNTKKKLHWSRNFPWTQLAKKWHQFRLTVHRANKQSRYFGEQNPTVCLESLENPPAQENLRSSHCENPEVSQQLLCKAQDVQGRPRAWVIAGICDMICAVTICCYMGFPKIVVPPHHPF